MSTAETAAGLGRRSQSAFRRSRTFAGSGAGRFRRTGFDRAAGAGGALAQGAASAGRSWSRSPSITACARKRKREAAAVERLARKLGVAHRTLRWTGTKPKTGLQEAARQARYRLLADAARKAGASHILTAHTLDDQAETVLIRLSRGSGLSGLAAMARMSPLPGDGEGEITLVRPLLDIPKARLIATLRAAKFRSPTIRPTAIRASPARGCAA